MTPQHSARNKPNPKYKTLLSLFVFCSTSIILCFLGYKVLNEGIYNQNISLGFVKIEGLYLKLENKFIVDIKKIDLSQSTLFTSTDDEQAQDSIHNLEDSIENAMGWVQDIFWVLSYFQTLNIHQAIFPNGTQRTLLYDGSDYKIFDPHFSAILSTAQSSKDIALEIQSLTIPELSLKIEGYMQYHISKKALDIHSLRISHTKILTKDTNIPAYVQITGSTDFQDISLTLNSSQWDQIQFLKPYITPLGNKTLESWLFEKIKFESLQLKDFKLKTSLNKNFTSNLFSSMRGSLYLQNPQIHLAPNTTPIIAPSATLNLSNKLLDIRFSSPSFSGYDLGDSNLQIELPINRALEVFVQLRSQKLTLEKPLLDLLHALIGIDLPVQTSSPLEASLDLTFKSDHKKIHPYVKGTIKGKNTNLTLFGQPISAQNIQTTLDIQSDKKQLVSIASPQAKYADILSTQLVFDIDALAHTLQGEFVIHHVDLIPSKIFPVHLKYPNLKNIDTSDPMTKRIVEVIIKENTSTLPSILQIPKQTQNTESTQPSTQLDSSTSPDSQPTAKSHPLRTITLQGNFKDGISLTIPKLSLAIKQDSALHLSLSSIESLYPHSPILQYFGIKKGNLTLHSQPQQPNTIALEAKLENLNYPIYDKNNQVLRTLEIEGMINPDEILLNTKDKNIKLQKRRNTISLVFNDYNLDVDHLMESEIPILYEVFHEEGESRTYTPEEIARRRTFVAQKRKFEREHDITPHILYLESNSMDILYGDFIIPTDSATITMRDKQINANAAYGNGIADINIAYGETKITLDNFSSNFINQVLSKRLFSGGLFDFSGTLKDRILQGEIRVQNTTFKDFAIVQNIVGLIDTIPSLIMFKKPGFSNDGYEIKQGSFLFSMNDEYLGFESIDLIGTAIDINGNGIVNLKDRTINLLLKASTMKALSNILSNIPIVGYVILGKDGKVTTNIIVSGELDNPKTEVSLLEDVVNAPFKMLHRIFAPLDNIVDSLIEEPTKQEQSQEKNINEEQIKEKQINEDQAPQQNHSTKDSQPHTDTSH
ncbi:AsmA-like C-terminal domain-containing protein [uncultured Helicobacter sp.]|uniref:YhdP family protein n=1 Tax=uncultured Helicobacter sp. TaxID=175537 RepID=UPI00374E702A